MKHTYNILIIIVLLLIAFLLYKKVQAPTTTIQPNTVATTTADMELKQSLPISCTQDPNGNGTPVVITDVSPFTVSVGGVLTVKGCNFSGFEGDKDLWIENIQSGIKGILYSKPGSTASMMMFDIPNQTCQQNNSYSGDPCTAYLPITPGQIYKIYTAPWGNFSNTVMIKVI